jgi:hypothetical protein
MKSMPLKITSLVLFAIGMAARPATATDLPEKSGFYQLSTLSCAVGEGQSLPENLNVPARFEIFLDVFAAMKNGGSASQKTAATLLLELTDVKTKRVIVEGAVQTSDDDKTTQIIYSFKDLQNQAVSAKILINASEGPIKATLTIKKDSAQYTCVES